MSRERYFGEGYTPSVLLLVVGLIQFAIGRALRGPK